MPTPMGFSTDDEWWKKKEANYRDSHYEERTDKMRSYLSAGAIILRPIIEKMLLEFGSVLQGGGKINVEYHREECTPSHAYAYWTNGKGAKITLTLDIHNRSFLIDFEDPREPSSQEMARVFESQCRHLPQVGTSTRAGKYYGYYMIGTQ